MDLADHHPDIPLVCGQHGQRRRQVRQRSCGLALGTDDVPVTVLWLGSTGQPDVTRNFAGFWELAQAQADSRVHGGIHYRFDNVAGQQSAIKVATFVFNNFMLPRKGD